MLHFAQRASEKNTALTATGVGMFWQSAGFLPSNELQIARRKSLGLRPPLYGLPFRKIVGEPVAPRFCSLVERRGEELLALAVHARLHRAGVDAGALAARLPVGVDVRRIVVLALDHLHVLVGRDLARAQLRDVARDLARPVHRAQLVALLLADERDVEVDVAAELGEDGCDRLLDLHAVRALRHDEELELRGLIDGPSNGRRRHPDRVIELALVLASEQGGGRDERNDENS